MKQMLADFTSFLQRDISFIDPASANIRFKLLFIVKAFVLLFLFKVIWGFISLQLLKYGLMNQTKGSGDLNTWLSEVSGFEFILQVVILAPILEETAFRGILQRDQSLVAVAVSVLFYLLICKSLNLNFYGLSKATLIVISGSVILLLMLYNWSFILTEITKNIDNHKTLLMWLSAVGFAFWHYHNYEFEGAPFYTILLVLFPHFVAGLFFSWTSLRYGFFWGLALHMFNNAIPVFITLIKSHGSATV